MTDDAELVRDLRVSLNQVSKHEPPLCYVGKKTVERAAATIERLTRERARFDIALQSLTPGGSEYMNDPERCVAYARQVRENQHKLICKAIRERKAAESAISTSQALARTAAEEVRERAAAIVEDHARVVAGGVLLANNEDQAKVSEATTELLIGLGALIRALPLAAVPPLPPAPSLSWVEKVRDALLEYACSGYAACPEKKIQTTSGEKCLRSIGHDSCGDLAAQALALLPAPQPTDGAALPDGEGEKTAAAPSPEETT